MSVALLRKPKDPLLSALALAARCRNAALAGLSPKALALIDRDLQLREYAAGETLWHFGSPIERVYFPQRGIISVTMPEAKGCPIEVGMAGSEAAAGGIGSCGEGQPTGGIALVDGVFWTIAAPQLAALAGVDSEIAMLRVLALEWMLTQGQQRAVCNAVHGAPQRVANYLLQLADRAAVNGSRWIHITQESIGYAIGVRRGTVSVIAQDMAADGMIGYRHARIQITNCKRLRACACDCYAALCPAASPFAATAAGPRPGRSGHLMTRGGGNSQEAIAASGPSPAAAPA